MAKNSESRTEDLVVKRFLHARQNDLDSSEITDIVEGLTRENSVSEQYRRRYNLLHRCKPTLDNTLECFLTVAPLHGEIDLVEKLLGVIENDQLLARKVCMELLKCVAMYGLLPDPSSLSTHVNGLLTKISTYLGPELLFSLLHYQIEYAELDGPSLSSLDDDSLPELQRFQRYLAVKSEMQNLCQNSLITDKYAAFVTACYHVKMDKYVALKTCHLIASIAEQEALSTDDKSALLGERANVDKWVEVGSIGSFVKLLSAGWTGEERLELLQFASFDVLSRLKSYKPSASDDSYIRSVAIQTLNEQPQNISNQLFALHILSPQALASVILTPTFIRHVPKIFHAVAEDCVADYAAPYLEYLETLKAVGDEVCGLLEYFPKIEAWIMKTRTRLETPLLAHLVMAMNEDQLSLNKPFLKTMSISCLYQLASAWQPCDWKTIDVLKPALTKLLVNMRKGDVELVKQFTLKHGFDWKLLAFVEFGATTLIPSMLHDTCLHQYPDLGIGYSSKITGHTTALLEAFLFIPKMSTIHLKVLPRHELLQHLPLLLSSIPLHPSQITKLTAAVPFDELILTISSSPVDEGISLCENQQVLAHNLITLLQQHAAAAEPHENDQSPPDSVHKFKQFMKSSLTSEKVAIEAQVLLSLL